MTSLEAPTLPCGRCGAPLPVDPARAHAWCPSCHRWWPIPREVVAQARRYLESLRSAREREAAQQSLAASATAHATVVQAKGRAIQIAFAVHLGLGLLGMIPAAAAMAADSIAALADEYEPWAVILAAAAGLGAGLVGVAFTATLGYVFWRRHRRHRREGERASAATPAAGGPAVGAVCSSCGGAVTFHPGQTSVRCAHCRAVVLPAAGQRRRLVALALERVHMAKLEGARAERKEILAEHRAKRSRKLLFASLFLGSLFCVAAPLAGVLYVVRTLTRSVEQYMEDLAYALHGDFLGGLELVFAWLDDFWVGATPQGLRDVPPSFFQTVWAVEASYDGRPVLLVAITDVTDRTAKSVFGLLARPRTRDAACRERARRSAEARRIEAAGWSVEVDDAGVVVRAANLRPAQLDAETFTRVMRAASAVAES